jgi:beta-lactamase regulating signal transducer with metallopeptidase domain
MWVWIDRFGLVLFDATASTAVFLSLIVLAVLVCRQPTRRLLITRVALFASLAMIPLALLMPLPRFDLMRALATRDLLPALFSSGHEYADAEGNGASERGGTQVVTIYLSRHTPSVAPWLPRGLVLLDLAGIGAGCAWIVLGFGGVQWLIRSAQPPAATTSDQFERLLGSGASSRPRPSLLVSPRIQHPVVVGLLRPTILIPPELEADDRDTDPIRLSLLHEMAHVERSDHRHGMIASLAQAVWFFLPHVWWLRSRLLIDQEFLADRLAARRYGTVSGYAASLLALAQFPGGSTADPCPTGPEPAWPGEAKTGVPSPLFQRVLMLLHCPFRLETRVRGARSWLLRASVIALSILSTCLLFRWPGAVPLEGASVAAATRRPHSFCLTDFVAEPLVFASGSRALPYVLPVVLPAHFDLSLEVRSRPDDLARVRIAGHALATPDLPVGPGHPQADHAPARPAQESWHQVRLERKGNDIALWVDGRPLPVTLSSQPTTEWLTIEPDPARATQFRNLVLTW